MKNTKSQSNILPIAFFTFIIAILFQSFCSVQTTARQIVGMGIAADNNQCYTWYNDGTMSIGNTTDLNDYHTINRYNRVGCL